MKKRLLLLAMILFLAVSCGKKGSDPIEVLTNVYQNHRDLESYTADMTIHLNIGSGDGSTMTLPVNMTLMYDSRNNKDVNDDQAYVKLDTDVFGEGINYQTWIKDGKMYADDGTNKTVSELTDYAETMQSYTNVDAAEMIKKLTDNLESLNVNPKDKGVELVMKPKETLFADLLSSSVFAQLDQFEDYDLDALKEVMKGLKLSDIVLTVDENQLLKDMSTALSMKYEEVDLLADLGIRFRDYNQTTLPALDESAFTEGSPADIIDIDGDDDSEDYDYNGSFIDIVFDDNATEIYVMMTETDRYSIYYDEEDYFITIYDGTDAIVDGLFLDKEFADEIAQEVQNNTNDFAVRGTESIDASFTDGSVLTGFSITDNDYFNPDTPFSIVTFDGCQYAIVFVGYESEEAFKAVMDQTSYMIYIQE